MKILIISYYSFPLNAVPSYRIESFCEGFVKEGGDVTLLTRHWDEKYSSLEDILESNKKPTTINRSKGYREIKLPYTQKRTFSKIPVINTFKVFFDYLCGNLQPEFDVLSNFKDYGTDLLNLEGDFDLIFTSVQPDGMTELANYISKKTNVPYVVDFRDFLNNKYLSADSKLSIREKVINYFIFLHTKRYLKNAKMAITVSPVLQNIFQSDLKKESILALNGYEQKYFLKKKNIRLQNKVFSIRHIGTAYPGLDFSIIITGILKFKKKYPCRNFHIELIGVHNDQIEKAFQDSFSKADITIVRERISKEEVIIKTINSDILLLACNLYKGVYGTKLFDYLASGSHILLSPPDNSVVEDLIRNNDNGSVANTADEVCQILEKQYLLWEKGANKSPMNNYPQFERENIAKELYGKLKQIVS